MKVAIFCSQSNFARLVSTVVVRLNQTVTKFEIVPVTSEQIDVGIVDAADAADCAMAQRCVKTQTQLQLINIVSFEGQALGINEVQRSNVVAGLMPALTKIVNAKSAIAASLLAMQNNLQTAAPKPKRVLRALAVDDSPTIRAQLQNILNRIGMQCDLAESAAAAIKKLEGQAYDIMYVDVVMPDMNGYELTRAVKKDRSRKAMPVIILTSQSSPFDRARGALAGCDTYLTKPVDAKRFFDATVKALSKISEHDMSQLQLIDPGSIRTTPAGGPSLAS